MSHAEAAQQLLEIARPRDRHGDVADRVFDDQIPADDPRDQLAERGVGVGVGRAGDRHHRRELRVAQRREAAGDRGQHEREDQRRSGAQVIRAARGRRADRREQSRADHRADAERGQLDGAEHAFEPMSGRLGFALEAIEGLHAEQVSHAVMLASVMGWSAGRAIQ